MVAESVAMLGLFLFMGVIAILSIPAVVYFRRKQLNPPLTIEQKTVLTQKELDRINEEIQSLEG